jgi:TolA-binding protein
VLKLNFDVLMKKILFAVIIPILYIFPQNPADTYKEAMHSYNSADYYRTIEIFNTFLSTYNLEDELYASANYFIAESHFNLKQNAAAVPYLEFLVNNQRWTAYRENALFRLGIIYFEDGKYERSRQNFRRMLSLFPESEFSGSALYWIGESFVREDRIEEAAKFLQEALGKRKNNKYLDYTIFSLATVYEKKGDYINAVKYYDQLLSFHSNSPLAVQAQIRIGICYFKLKDYESSILELNNPLLNELPEELYSESLYLLANSYFRTGSYADAEKVYREISEKYPAAENIREVNYALAWSLFQQKKYNDAYKIFNFLSEEDDQIAEKSFLWKAEARRYAGKETEAFELYKKFLERYPESPYTGQIQYQMGVIYFGDKKPDVSERYLLSALKSNDKRVRANAYTLKGEIELNKKDYQAARNSFMQVPELADKGDKIVSRAYLGLGTVSYYLKDYKNGIEYLTKVSTDDPEFERNKVNYYLAENLYAAGKYQDAIARYNNISQDDRELFGKAIYGKAYCYLNSGRYDQAAAQFSEFLKKYPNNKNAQDARIRLADSYYGNKNYAAASGIYRELFSGARIQVDNPHLYYQYAQSLYRGGKTEEAISRLFELRDKYPQSDYASRAYYLIGWIYFQKGDYNRAVSQYKNTLSLYPSGQIAPIVYYSIGDAYYNIGKYDSAIVNYEKIIDLFPGSANVFDALNGIQYSYIALNQPERAVETIESFISENPNVDYADQLAFKRGEIYYSNRSYEKAKNSYKSFLNNYRNSKLIPDAYFWIGKSAQNLGQSEEAVYNYNRVLENYPKTIIASSAAIELSAIYNQMKNYDASVNLLNKIISQTSTESPARSEFMFLKGMTLLQKGDRAGAADTFDELAMYYRNTVFGDKAKFELGLLDLESKNYSAAERNFRELAETRSDDIGAKSQYYYGETLFQQKKIEEAVTAFVRVRTVFSAYEEWLVKSYLRLGDSYIELQDSRRAAEMYRAVISRSRGDIYTEEAQKKLRAIK